MKRNEKVDYYMRMAGEHGTRRVIEVLLEIIDQERRSRLAGEARAANREPKP